VRIAVVLLAVIGCGDDIRAGVTIASATWTDALHDMALYADDPFLTVDAVADPAALLATPDDRTFRIVVIDDPTMPLEGYRIDLADGTVRTWSVRAHDVLGTQYGVAAALEHLGFRFRHPYDPYVPQAPAADDATLGVVHAPQVRVRGLHLHTEHPIEGYYAMWDPPDGGDEDARRAIDWLVKNRGNYIEFFALDDIYDPTRHDAWAQHARDVLDYAHSRGVRVGLAVELFKAADLQLGFDLTEDASAPAADQIASRLPLIVDGLPFDAYQISFGEFFDTDPQVFVDALDEATRQFHAAAPAAEVHAVVHVGATQIVTYMGQQLNFYFLVKYADPSIIPDIHSVMYYDLFEDAGGAYQCQDFFDHRQYLIDRACAGQPAAYYPETAYWVAFDDSVPQYLPLYVDSRLLDLARLPGVACGPLDEHLVFSSGWEWGFWLHDTTTLRASYELPDSPRAAIAEQLGAKVGDVVADLADAQHDALIGQRLAPYLASRDALIDAGRSLHVISQPDRMTFDDLVAADDATRTAFVSDVMTPLDAYATQLDGLAARAPSDDTRWAREVRDGFAIDRARAHFIEALYLATLDHIVGDDAAAAKDRATAVSELATALSIVHGRHHDLHDPHGDRLIAHSASSTAYDFAYLYMADTLCYWHRELDQVDAILGNTTMTPPSCLL
jgi:hypothetical protein